MWIMRPPWGYLFQLRCRYGPCKKEIDLFFWISEFRYLKCWLPGWNTSNRSFVCGRISYNHKVVIDVKRIRRHRQSGVNTIVLRFLPEIVLYADRPTSSKPRALAHELSGCGDVTRSLDYMTTLSSCLWLW